MRPIVAIPQHGFWAQLPPAANACPLGVFSHSVASDMPTPAAPLVTSPPVSPQGDARLTSRLTVGYLLDAIANARGDNHPLDTLLYATISQANVMQISRQADLQVAFAGADDAPPDDMRRPVSMNALAASLSLPFETVRRRVRGLIQAGMCQAVDGGIVVPTAVVSSPQYLRVTTAAYERLGGFYRQLMAYGLLKDLPPANVELQPDLVPLRTVARISTDYLLRVVDSLVRAVGNMIQGLILLEVVRSNTEHLHPHQRGGEGALADDFVPDGLRRPVSVTEVAQRLGLPIETVRRHVTEMQARGLCVRATGGLLVPAEVLARPAFAQFTAENLTNLNRMFASLSQLGVLAVWDRQAAA